MNTLRKARDKANNPITAFLALMGFLWLGWYAWHHEAPAKLVTLIMQQGYSVADRQAMHGLLVKVKQEKRLSRDNAAKMIALYGEK